jgi:uncharacterized protein (TIGR00730 family)
MKTVALFGSAKVTPDQAIYRETTKAAQLLAENGWCIATGGGPGLMEAANIGAKQGCTGATCSLGYSIYLPNEACTNAAVQINSHHNDFFTRLKQFTDDCSAFIALPGGVGTKLEILTVAQLLQVGHIEPRPLILVGPMWKKIMDYSIKHLHANGFVSDCDLQLWAYAKKPMDAARMLLD